MWKGTSVITNALGQDEAYSIAPDGFIWSYTIDAELGRTGRLMSTGLKASTFALGKSGDGLTLVIAADGAKVQYVVESGNPNQRWSTPTAVTFPAAFKNAVSIDTIFTQTLAGNLFVGVLARHTSAECHKLYQFWECVWARGSFVFCNSPVNLEGPGNIWLEKISNSLESLN